MRSALMEYNQRAATSCCLRGLAWRLLRTATAVRRELETPWGGSAAWHLHSSSVVASYLDNLSCTDADTYQKDTDTAIF
jgi:hypothetical protein